MVSVNTYNVIIKPSEHGGFYAVCNTDNGGFNAVGESLREVQRNIFEALELYLDDNNSIDYLLHYEVAHA